MMATITTDSALAAQYVQEGRIAAFPTGTSYGLAAHALMGHALQRLRNLKGRPEEKPFSVCMAPRLWDTYLSLTQEERRFLTGHTGAALTLLVTPKEQLMHLAHEGLVALRGIDHPLMAHFAERVDVPITATSANKSGDEPCYDPLCIQTSFPEKVGTTYDLSLACILDAGALPVRGASTIAKLSSVGKIEIIRQGSLVLHTASKR